MPLASPPLALREDLAPPPAEARGRLLPSLSSLPGVGAAGHGTSVPPDSKKVVACSAVQPDMRSRSIGTSSAIASA